MSAENNFQATEKAGLLDKVVGLVTLGKYGVDQVVGYGLKDDYSGEIFQEDPTVHTLKTQRAVSVSDMSKTRHVLKTTVVQRKP